MEFGTKFDQGGNSAKKEKPKKKWATGEDLDKVCAIVTQYMASPMNHPVS
jgi:hypothetical protein